MSLSAKILNAAAAGLAALVIVGCSTPDRTASQVFNDKMTAHRVKKDLAKAPIFKYPDVAVNSFNGTVQLNGFVDTEEQRIQAADIASRTKGVHQVINDIMIKPMATGRATVRDPLGRETGRVMVDTNAPPRQPLRMQPNQVAPESNSQQNQPAPQENQP